MTTIQFNQVVQLYQDFPEALIAPINIEFGLWRECIRRSKKAFSEWNWQDGDKLHAILAVNGTVQVVPISIFSEKDGKIRIVGRFTRPDIVDKMEVATKFQMVDMGAKGNYKGYFTDIEVAKKVCEFYLLADKGDLKWSV